MQQPFHNDLVCSVYLLIDSPFKRARLPSRARLCPEQADHCLYGLDDPHT